MPTGVAGEPSAPAGIHARVAPWGLQDPRHVAWPAKTSDPPVLVAHRLVAGHPRSRWLRDITAVV